MRTYNFGRGKWVFVDWLGLDPGYGTAWGGDESMPGESLPTGLELKVHPPRLEPGWVLAPERPWDQCGISPYASFVEDQGRFHCWYECYGNESEMGIHVNVAYAVSDDGVHWSRPDLGVREYGGSRQNNLTNLGSHGACVFIDPTAPPEERYKTAGLHVVPPETPDPSHDRPQCQSKWWRQVGGAVSADGFDWQPLTTPILPRHFCDTQTVVEYDPVLQKYVLFTRQKNGLMGRRGVNRSESADFRSFPPSTPIFESNPLDPVDWDFQSPGYHRWPGAEHAHLMFPTVFHRASDRMSIHLATSRDGVCWHRPLQRQAWLDPADVHLAEDVMRVHSCHGILRTAPGEWSLYFRPYYHGHNAEKLDRRATGLMRAVCREDGFVSLSSEGHGEFWTAPFILDSASISLNLKCAPAGHLRIGVERVLGDYDNMGSVQGEAIEGHALADCEPLEGDHIDAEPTWRGGSLSELHGQTVRLHVQMCQADLYAIRFEQDS